MRQFVVDELSKEEQDNLESYLKRTLKAGPMEGMFWLPVPDDLLAEAQQGHEQCGPFFRDRAGAEPVDRRVFGPQPEQPALFVHQLFHSGPAPVSSRVSRPDACG